MGGIAAGEKRARVALALEAVALALVASLPLLPYFLYLREHAVARFTFEGDYAGLELATRYVPSFATLLGPYSRFGFNHPGPLYFYALSPLYELSGQTSTGILAGACTINAAAAIVIVVAVRLATTRAHAVAAALVVLAWLGAFGDVCALPWNPLVVVLPLIAYLVLAALVANGWWAALPLAVIAGAFVAETHLSTVPSVVGIAVATGGAVVWGRRRGRFDRPGRVTRGAAVAAFVIAIAPPLVEELVSADGNLTKLARFFGGRAAPLRPFSAAIVDWALAASWLPDRLFSSKLVVEVGPEVMRSEPPMDHLSATALRCTLALLVCAGVAFAIAWRRREVASVALLGAGGLGSAIGAVALRAIVGVNYTYLLFWTTAATTVLWMGVLTTTARALADLFERSSRAPLRRAGPYAAFALLLVAAAHVSSLQRAHLARGGLVPPPSSREREAYRVLRAYLGEHGETPVFHAEGAWNYGLAFLLEATKDGIDARIVERDRWIFGRQPRRAAGVLHPLHVYFQAPDAPLRIRDCAQKLVGIEGLEVYASETDVEVCPENRAPPTTP